MLSSEKQLKQSVVLNTHRVKLPHEGVMCGHEEETKRQY